MEIGTGTNSLIKLMRFIQVEGLVDLCIVVLFLILQFVILGVYNYVEIMNG